MAVHLGFGCHGLSGHAAVGLAGHAIVPISDGTNGANRVGAPTDRFGAIHAGAASGGHREIDPHQGWRDHASKTVTGDIGDLLSFRQVNAQGTLGWGHFCSSLREVWCNDFPDTPYAQPIPPAIGSLGARPRPKYGFAGPAVSSESVRAVRVVTAGYARAASDSELHLRESVRSSGSCARLSNGIRYGTGFSCSSTCLWERRARATSMFSEWRAIRVHELSTVPPSGLLAHPMVQSGCADSDA